MATFTREQVAEVFRRWNEAGVTPTIPDPEKAADTFMSLAEAVNEDDD